MKNILYALALTLIFLACKKQGDDIDPNRSDYRQTVQNNLKDSLSPADYASLDFQRSVVSGIDSLDLKFLRVPAKGKAIESDFFVAETDESGHVLKGRFVTIVKDAADKTSFTGVLQYRNMKGESIKPARMVKGRLYKTSEGNASSLMADEPVIDGGDLPPVVVTYSPGAGGISYADWYNLLDMAGGDSGGYSGYYSPSTGGGGGGGSSAPTVQVDFENPESKDGIDVDKYVKCFGTTQSASSDYTITIAVDLPVDNDPSKFFNWSDASPGHTFIEFYKNGDGGLVQQNLGFYPNSSWKTVVGPDNIASKVADDGGHEYQAKYTIAVSASQFLQAVNTAKTYSTHDYNVAEFNCADYALQVFRAAGGNLNVPQYQIPGFPSGDGSNTPEGVYDAIARLVLSGNKAAVANGQKQWIGDSHGPCD